MKVITIITVITAIIESTIVAFPLTLVLVIVLAVLYGVDALWPLFLAGIILDLFNQGKIGVSSLLFLTVLFLVTRYQKKVHLMTLFKKRKTA